MRKGTSPIQIQALGTRRPWKPNSKCKRRSRLFCQSKGILIVVLTKKILTFRIQRSNIEALSPERVAEAEQQTRELLADMVARKTKSKGKGPWIFGTEDPTALDAHLVIFLTRLQDVGRHEFIPAELQVYADMAMETPAFNAVFLDVPSGRTVPQKGLKKLLYSNGVE